MNLSELIKTGKKLDTVFRRLYLLELARDYSENRFSLGRFPKQYSKLLIKELNLIQAYEVIAKDSNLKSELLYIFDDELPRVSIFDGCVVLVSKKMDENIHRYNLFHLRGRESLFGYLNQNSLPLTNNVSTLFDPLDIENTVSHIRGIRRNLRNYVITLNNLSLKIF